MLVMIDNYDSFTYNLVQYFGELGSEVKVYRNDEITVSELAALKPDGIVISPGPCTPNEAGISLQVVRELYQDFPILGVCLGHQSIGQVFGGEVVRARALMHGKTSAISHNDKGVFAKLPNPMTVTRYHSLVVKQETLPDCLEITAWSTFDHDTGNPNPAGIPGNGDFDEIMGFQHRDYPQLQGVQFHPESIATPEGHALLQNFLDLL